MNDNLNKGFDQIAAFQRLWTDSFANMASVWSQFTPVSSPSDEMRKMRGGMLKVLAETWDEYMRTPQFMEMMKASLNGDDRVANLDEKIDKVDQRIAKQENAIERWGQTSKTKAQKPAATTGVALYLDRRLRSEAIHDLNAVHLRSTCAVELNDLRAPKGRGSEYRRLK